jgi:hypothetical protein
MVHLGDHCRENEKPRQITLSYIDLAMQAEKEFQEQPILMLLIEYRLQNMSIVDGLVVDS